MHHNKLEKYNRWPQIENYFWDYKVCRMYKINLKGSLTLAAEFAAPLKSYEKWIAFLREVGRQLEGNRLPL